MFNTLDDEMDEIVFMKQLKKLYDISNHVKSQLDFHSQSNTEITKVHFQRLLPFLNRLLSLELNRDILSLFDVESSETLAQQSLDLLSSIGEITKVSGGYYLPLPERAIQLPISGKNISVSDRGDMKSEIPYFGLASGYVGMNTFPLLSINEWLPSIDIQEFMTIMNNSRYYEINDEPTHIFIAKDKREWTSYESVRSASNITFIAKFTVQLGPAQYYWSVKRKNKINYCQIPNKYLDIAKFTLESQAEIHRTVSVSNLNKNILKLKFRHRIPKEERNMLMLFALPENVYDPFNWIMPKTHFEDLEYIISNIGMKSSF